MRTWIKHALPIVAVCVFGAGLSACGSSGASGGGSDSASDSGEISGTVEVWDYEYESVPGYTKAVNQIDAEFEKLHPGVTVDRVAQPQEGYEAVYRSAFAAREGPDVM